MCLLTVCLLTFCVCFTRNLSVLPYVQAYWHAAWSGHVQRRDIGRFSATSCVQETVVQACWSV